MSANLNLSKPEPVAIMAAINAAVSSTIGILTLTETISAEVGGAIATALGAWILVAALLITRRQVTPNEVVEAKVEEALNTPVPKAPKPTG